MKESKVKAILGVLYPLISLIVINLLQIASVNNALSFFLSRGIDRPVDLVDQSHKRLLDQSQRIAWSI